jgi:hypothetical protein
MPKISVASRLVVLGLLSLIVAGCIGDSDNATSVTATTARLNGHGRPDGGAVWSQYYFKWGTTTAYGNVTPTVTISQALDETIQYPIYADISGLAPGTTYHFTVCGRDSNDTWGTPDGFFCTTDRVFTTFSLPALATVSDPSFELQSATTIGFPWSTEGPDAKGIDTTNYDHTGTKNVWFNFTGYRWNAIRQTIPVAPQTNYALTAWVRNDNGSWSSSTGEIGVRTANNTTVLSRQQFGDTGKYIQLRVDFNSGAETSINIYVGLRGVPGINTWMRVDDVALTFVSSGPGPAQPHVPPVATTAPPSAFAAVAEELYNTFPTRPDNDGDLWPSCWGDDDVLYTANGDGKAFSKGVPRADIAVSRVTGSPYNSPPTLWGDTLAREDAVGQVWTPGGDYNRKPTGMLCLGSDLYVAVQDLKTYPDFNDPRAASISVSHDRGLHWSWDHSQPMFSGNIFTTMFFLDFGKASVNSFDEYVYVYGIDGNWAGATALYLARVPKTSVQTRSAWTFYAGIAGGEVQWTADIGQKVPVLNTAPYQVISQGSVVYNPYFDRYLFATWALGFHQMWEAQAPWGPWRLILNQGFSGTITDTNQWGYATTTPSKWISANGRTMWLQSNFWDAPNVPDAYSISLRRVTLTPAP